MYAHRLDFTPYLSGNLKIAGVDQARVFLEPSVEGSSTKLSLLLI